MGNQNDKKDSTTTKDPSIKTVSPKDNPRGNTLINDSLNPDLAKLIDETNKNKRK